VGSGDKSKTEELAHSLGISQDVVVLGCVDNITLRKCYVACDILVSPSLFEGFGLVILEAMAAGKPVIALNRGAVPELVKNGLNGLLVGREDAEELASAMTLFIDQPDIVDEMGRTNRNVASKFTWRRTAELTQHVYERALG
jgi:glycosyltransferase involved in cell wall biosynthesis